MEKQNSMNIPEQLSSPLDVLQRYHEQANKKLKSPLKKYDFLSTVTTLSAMLLDPQYQSHTERIEGLLFIALANCRYNGKQKPTRHTFNAWFNNTLSRNLAQFEDHIEDVFVSNLCTPRGNFLILHGQWEGTDFALDTLFSIFKSAPTQFQQVLDSCYDLLEVTQLIYKKMNLTRWETSTAYSHQSPILISKHFSENSYAKRVIVSKEELNNSKIEISKIKHFCHTNESRCELKCQTINESLFYSKPLFLLPNGDIVLLLPGSIGFTINNHILSECKKLNQLDNVEKNIFQQAVLKIQNAISSSNKRFSISNITRLYPIPEPHTKIHNHIMEISQNNFLHLCFLNNNLTEILKNNSYGCLTFPASSNDVYESIAKIQSNAISTNKINNWITLIVLSPLGYNECISISQDLPFPVHGIIYEELEIILRSETYPIEEILILLKQVEQFKNEMGCQINYISLINLYAYWRKNNYLLLPTDVSYVQVPSQVNILSGEAYDFKVKQKRLFDIHMVAFHPKIYEEVMRITLDSFYEYEKYLPIYISTVICDDEFRSCFEVNNITFWFIFNFHNSCEESRDGIYELVKGLTSLCFSICQKICISSKNDSTTVKIRMHFNFEAITEILVYSNIYKGVRYNSATQIIHINNEIIPTFCGDENSGEILILEAIFTSIRDQGMQIPNNIDIKSHISTTGKIIHFPTRGTHPLYMLLLELHDKEFSLSEPVINEQSSKAFQWRIPPQKTIELSQDESISVLNKCVTHVCLKLKKELSQINRNEIIKLLLNKYATLSREKYKWHFTSKAIMGLHGFDRACEAAKAHEDESSAASLYIRSLIEASIYTCHYTEGLVPDDFQIDELLGLIAVIIEAGGLSTAIFHKIVSGGIILYPNGRYGYSNKDLGELISAYKTDLFQQYFNSYITNMKGSSIQSKFTLPEPAPNNQSAFEDVFQVEFKLSYDTALKIIDTLYQLASSKKSVFLEVTSNEIYNHKSNNITLDNIKIFMENFSLQEKLNWCMGEDFKKTAPWRFGRRQSLSYKPIIKLNNETNSYIISINLLLETIGLIKEHFLMGNVNHDFLISKLAKKFIGSIANQQGSLFNKIVGICFEKAGLSAHTEIKMTILGAPKKPNIGDVDVIAYDATRQIIFICECKNLKQAKTIYEIASICKKFRGESSDMLAKHLCRVDWIKENKENIRQFFNISPDIDIRIVTPLICSNIVPFMYIKNLPLSSKDIITIAQLPNYIENTLIIK